MKDINIFKLIVFITLVLQCSLSIAQNVTGTITQKGNNTISNCAITISLISRPLIIEGYTISNNKGAFTIPITKYNDSVILSFSKLGFKTKTLILNSEQQQLSILLEESVETLEEVILETPPITYRNDTLSYNVGSFKNKSDVAIRDVLARLPGIEVLPSGQIKYEGEPIEKFYIEGLDLLEGRYNIANNNLPASSISKIQVLENHQSKKILDSLQPSTKTSINLTLKNKSIATTLISVGIGAYPFTRDGKIVPLYFTKKDQFIGLYKTNSNGEDILSEVKDVNSSEGFTINQDNDSFTLERLTSILPIQTPIIESINWLFNNSNVASINYLKRLNNDFQIKTSMSYVNDNEQQKGTRKTAFLLPQNTFEIEETIKNKYNISSLTGYLVIEKNISKIFFKNKTSINSQQKIDNGITLGESNTNQRAKLQRNVLSNKLQITLPLQDSALSFESDILYNEDQENLNLKDSISFNIDNQNLFLSDQRIKKQNLKLLNNVSLTKKVKNVSLEYKIGWDYIFSDLKSLLITNTPLNLSNNLQLVNSQQYITIGGRYFYNGWAINSYNRLNNNSINIERDNKNKISFEPLLVISKKLNKRYKLNISGEIKNTFTGVTELYNTPILLNFRTINRFDTPIVQTKASTTALQLNYKNILSGVFNNLKASYTGKTEDRTLSSETDQSGILTTQAIDRANTATSFNLTASLSKQIFKYNTNVKLNVNRSINTTNIFLANTLSEIKNKALQVQTAINFNGIDRFTIDYNTQYSERDTQISSKSLETFKTQSHTLNISYFTKTDITLQARAYYYRFKTSQFDNNNLFFNTSATYTSMKKVKYTLSFNNLLNAKEFVSGTNSTFFISTSTYRLRPRNVFLNVSFSL